MCQASLGWNPGDPNHAFFSWKHDENPFGASPMWLAEEPDGEIIGVRAFLNWRFTTGDGEIITAVRAVDTATLPRAQGRGVFRRLTLGAIPDLRDDGVDVIFNTPNDKSRPGYIKMGWNEVGRVPVAVRVRNPLALRRVIGANTSASKWSEPTSFGRPAAEAFADDAEVERLLRSTTRPSGIATARDAAFLRWRYSFGPLHYRVLDIDGRSGHGAVVFRVRRRGPALEAAVCDVIGPPELRTARALGAVLRGTGADYLVIARDHRVLRSACLPIPRLGPLLTWRSVSRPGTPSPSDLELTVGDVELF